MKEKVIDTRQVFTRRIEIIVNGIFRSPVKKYLSFFAS